MPFLSTIEEMAEERGEIKGEIQGEIKAARKNCQDNILKILTNRFDSVPELMSNSRKKRI